VLSIVVPIYNASRHLSAMLDSVYRQRYREREVILVDDGSTDGSGSIIDSYRRRHAETRVVRQPHRGVSVARNAGLELARGEYIAFADADDVLLPRMYSMLVGAAEREELDMALCNAQFLRDGIACERICRSLPSGRVMSGLEWLRIALEARELLHAVWPTVYRTAFLRTHGFRFIPGLIYRQDVPWTTEALLCARRVQYLEEPLYLYRVQNRPPDPGRWKLIARSYIGVLDALSELNREHAARLRPVLGKLRWQITDQGLRIFHQVRRLPALADRVALFREMRVRGTDRLIRENASGYTQKRRAFSRLAYMYLVLLLSAAVLPDTDSTLSAETRTESTEARLFSSR